MSDRTLTLPVTRRDPGLARRPDQHRPRRPLRPDHAPRREGAIRSWEQAYKLAQLRPVESVPWTPTRIWPRPSSAKLPKPSPLRAPGEISSLKS